MQDACDEKLHLACRRYHAICIYIYVRALNLEHTPLMNAAHAHRMLYPGQENLGWAVLQLLEPPPMHPTWDPWGIGLTPLAAAQTKP